MGPASGHLFRLKTTLLVMSALSLTMPSPLSVKVLRISTPSRLSLDGSVPSSLWSETMLGVFAPYMEISSCNKGEIGWFLLHSTSAANRNGTHLVRRVVDRSSGLMLRQTKLSGLIWLLIMCNYSMCR